MMEPIDMAEKILDMNSMLEKMRAEIKNRSVKKANTISEYDKSLALTIIKLRNGVEVPFEGEVVKDPPVTILEKIAKGICWKERLEMETHDAEYKSLITNIETLKAQLNGLQSVNRHLDQA